MKTSKIFLAMALAASMGACSPNQSQDQTAGADPVVVMDEILNARHSTRAYDTTKTVDDALMLKVLWAGFGVNREDGKRTAPSAINAQDVHLFLCTADGVSEYDAKANALKKVTDADIRPMIALHNPFILSVPTILIVSNQEPFANFGPEYADILSAMDAGIVSENISLYCTAAGLATVCCAPRMDAEAVQQALNLPSTWKPLIYHPIGYAAQ